MTMSDNSLILKAVKGPFASSHLSIFPYTSIGGKTPTSSNIVSVNFIPADGGLGYRVPGNVGYYFSERLEPKFRWNPPRGLLDILCGKDIIVYSSEPVNNKVESVGWIDYAHPNGIVHSGMDYGLYGDVHPFHTNLKDTLIECEDHNNVKAAPNCEGQSDAFLENLQVLSDRARFITKLAMVFDQLGIEEGLKYVQQNITQAIDCYGVNNVITTTDSADSKTTVVRFPTMVVIPN